jgi:tRNA threonylcarbamoyladenosine biosynthesis protein TsaE
MSGPERGAAPGESTAAPGESTATPAEVTAAPAEVTATPAEVTAATAGEMRELGRRIAGLLRAGDLVILNGALGAGKTTLVQGIGEGLGVRGPVTSPTFVIARVHPSLTGGPALVHADAYRLTSPAEVDDLDLDETVDSSVTVIEWGGGMAEGLAADRLEVTITTVGEGRAVRVTGHGARWAGHGDSAFCALSGVPEGL